MRWSFKIGTIAGIRIEVHVTFLLFVGWMAISRGLSTGNAGQALETAGILLATFGCVLLHELGHATAARRYGIRTRDIILLPIGGLARLERMPEKPLEEIVVAIAGPLVNVVIGSVLWLVTGGLNLAEPLLSGGFLSTLLQVNIIMVLFNLIPAFPMDGGRVLRATLAFWLPHPRATRIAAGIGQGIAVIFAILGLTYHLTTLLLIAVFVFLAAAEERTQVQRRASFQGIPVHAAMITDFRVLGPDEPLQRAVDLLMTGSQQDFPVIDGRAPLGVLTRADLVSGLQRLGPGAEVRAALHPSTAAAEADEPVEQAMQRMVQLRRSSLPVVHDGGFVGMITLENIGELLAVRDALRRHARGA